MKMRAITEKLVSKRKLVSPTGSSAAKDPPTETKGWATYVKKVPIEAKRANTGGTLQTLEGPARYRRGDWIARGAKGEKWPIRSDVFAKTYRRVGEAYGVSEKAAAAMGVPSLRSQFGAMSARAAGHVGSKARKRKKWVKKAWRIDGPWAQQAMQPTKDLIEWAKTDKGRRAILAAGGVALLAAGGVGLLDRTQNESLRQSQRYPE